MSFRLTIVYLCEIKKKFPVMMTGLKCVRLCNIDFWFERAGKFIFKRGILVDFYNCLFHFLTFIFGIIQGRTR